MYKRSNFLKSLDLFILIIYLVNYYLLTKGQVVYLRVRGYSTSVSGTYYLKVSPSHTHSYTYEHYSSTHHKSTCNCGEVTYQAHAVSSSGTNRYKPCIQCGYLVDTQNDIGIIGPTANVKYKTNAGSYILPNGIIVLVNEDIEAYLNGTLEFNDSNMELS